MKTSPGRLKCGPAWVLALWATLLCAACHRSAPSEAPRLGVPSQQPHERAGKAALGLAPSSSEALRTSSGDEREPAEQQESGDLEPLPSSGDASRADDLVFLVPSALPEGATVLHIGDSFAGALGRQLNRALARRGLKGVLEFETGTYIGTWASTKRLGPPLARHRPDLVLITLGANELDIARPKSRANGVRKLVAALGGRPCVWIAPPLWKGAKPDVLHVIEDNCAPCVYLDSTKLVPNLERLADGVHPSSAGRARWAQAVATWLDEHRVGDLEPRWVSLEP